MSSVHGLRPSAAASGEREWVLTQGCGVGSRGPGFRLAPERELGSQSPRFAINGFAFGSST